MLGLNLRTPGTIKGWIQEEGNCKATEGVVDQKPLFMKKDSPDVEDCANRCVNEDKCGAFTVLGPGTQEPAKCTFFKVGFTGNLEAGYLCYVHEEKARAAGFKVGESSPHSKKTMRGAPGPAGPNGVDGADIPPTKGMLPALGGAFIVNLLLSAFLFDLARKEFRDTNKALMKEGEAAANPEEGAVPPDAADGQAEDPYQPLAAQPSAAPGGDPAPPPAS
jgi:hypothetical protein